MHAKCAKKQLQRPPLVQICRVGHRALGGTVGVYENFLDESPESKAALAAGTGFMFSPPLIKDCKKLLRKRRGHFKFNIVQPSHLACRQYSYQTSLPSTRTCKPRISYW
jgi:hypothetical protein